MTRVILATFFLAFTSNAFSQAITVTNTFVDGQIASAAEVNTNFNDIVTGVNAIVRKDDDQTITAVGLLALDKNTSEGRFNTALGSQALGNNESGTVNTATGHKALFTNITGKQNSALGSFALQNNTGDDNTAIGYGALLGNTTGEFNTASGAKALFGNTEGVKNTASGFQALYKNITGGKNTASGYEALFSNTYGGNNTASGAGALYTNTEGGDNTASGVNSLFFNKTGSFNTASGYAALQNNTTGRWNTASGSLALITNKEGSKNTAIGYDADVTESNLENATAIGYKAKVNASNTVQIGNTDVQEVRTSGTFFSGGVQVTSDARLKENITVVDVGLALVNDLNPVSYHRINSSSDDIEMGLLAQEVEEVLATHGLSNSGMVHQASEDAYRSVRYNDLLAPMIRAIQELDDAAETKDQQIASLQEQLTEQQGSLLSMIAAQQEQITQLQSMVNQQYATR